MLKSNLSKEENLLLKIQGLDFFAGSMGGIFLTLFLFKLGNFKVVTEFGLITLFSLFVVYVSSGWLLKKFSSKDIIKTGLLISALLYLLFFLLRENSIVFLIPLAIIKGVGDGLYWSGNNLTNYIVTHESTRNEFFGWQNFVMNIASAVGSIIAGGIIGVAGIVSSKNTGYAVIFLIVAIIICFMILLVSKLPHHSGIQFTLRDVFTHKRKRAWKIILTQQFLYGLWDVAFSTFSTILIFFIVKEEFTLGIFNTVNTLVFGISCYFIGKILQKNKNLYLIGGLIAPIGLLLFALWRNWLGIFSLIFIVGLSLPFLNITFYKSIYDAIDKEEGSWKNKYHLLLERDSVLGIARMTNYFVLLLFFNPQNQIEITKNWLLIIPVIPFLIGLLQLYSSHLQKHNTYEAVSTPNNSTFPPQY